MPKSATKPAKKLKKNTVTPEKKILGNNTFQALADHVGARIADLADEVFAADPDATVGDLRHELDMLVGSLDDFVGNGDGEYSDDTPLATLR